MLPPRLPSSCNARTRSTWSVQLPKGQEPVRPKPNINHGGPDELELVQLRRGPSLQGCNQHTQLSAGGSPVLSSTERYSPILSSIHQYSAISNSTQQYSLVLSSIHQYSAVLSGIQQYSAVLSNILQYSAILSSIQQNLTTFTSTQ